MGCFLACFGGSRERKCRSQTAASAPPRVPTVEICTLSPPSVATLPAPIPRCSPQILSGLAISEPVSFNCVIKKVTFDPNVKTHETSSSHDDTNFLFDGDMERAKEKGEEINTDSNNIVYDESDDEEDIHLVKVENEESYDSFFPLHTNKDYEGSEKDYKAVEEIIYSTPNALVRRSGRDRSHYVHSVLNPVENLAQWKEAKIHEARPPLAKQEAKENATWVEEEPKMKKKTPKSSEVSVETSLSTWLVTPESSTTMECSHNAFPSPRSSAFSREEQPILGAVTVEDLKQSATSSPWTSSPSSRSLDERPILGADARGWSNKTRATTSDGSRSRGIPNTTSKYKEDKKVSWHSTPFEARLEKALRG